MTPKAVVNKIIPFSSVDGPGNRTAIFLQGCNIDCKYCHNPETRGVCINCGECVLKCPNEALSIKDNVVIYDVDKCCLCDECIHTCKHNSSPRTMLLSTDEVMEQVKKQIPFIRGITVSGGECMLRPDFLTELFSKAKAEALTTMIDSNGTISFKNHKELLEVTDGVMLDIKAFEESDHINITGHSNKVVLENASFLAKEGKLFEVRIVVVPDLYDAKNSVVSIGDYLKDYYRINPFRIKLIAYRPMGVREEYSHYLVPKQEFMEDLKGVLINRGYEDIIII